MLLPFVAVFIVDVDLRYRSVLGVGGSASHMDPDRYVGRPVSGVRPSELTVRMRALFERALAGETVTELIGSLGGCAYEGTFGPFQFAGVEAGAMAVVREVTVERHIQAELAASNALYQLLINNTGDVVMLSGRNGDRIDWISPSVERVIGWRPSDMIGHRALEFVHSGDAPDLQAGVAELVAGADQVQVPYRTRTPGGDWLWMEARIRQARDDTGALTGYLTTLRDVSDRHVLEVELDTAHRMFALAFAAAPIGMAIVAPDGRYLQVNDALCELLHCPSEMLLATTVQAVTHPDDRGDTLLLFEKGFDDIGPGFRLEKRYLRPDGTEVSVLVAFAIVRNDDGSPKFCISQVEDVTERRHAQLEMERLATTDPLTGLPNRTLLMDRLRHSLSLAQRENRRVGLLFIDLDYFKQVNDTLGHDAGDELLRRVALRLAESTRDGDTTTRLGGDEFVVVCPQVRSRAEVEDVAERIHAALGAPFVVAGHEVVVSASVGITVGDSDDDPEQLLRDADRAMYAAKHGNRDRVDVYTAALDDMAVDRLVVHAELRAGFTRNEITPFFQPILDLRTGRIIGQEALARWRHPTRGLLAPGAFLAGVDRGPLGVQLGESILRTACNAAAGWPAGLIHVNISAHHLASSRFTEFVEKCLAEAGLEPSRLVLEITESLVLTASRSTLKATSALHDLGVGLSIDDFGTGYSSITALHSLPINSFKIDRSFVAGVGTDPASSGLVDGLVSLGERMGLDVVAEGVETAEQAAWLRDHGCPYAQGYLFGRPTPEAKLG